MPGLWPLPSPSPGCGVRGQGPRPCCRRGSGHEGSGSRRRSQPGGGQLGLASMALDSEVLTPGFIFNFQKCSLKMCLHQPTSTWCPGKPDVTGATCDYCVATEPCRSEHTACYWTAHGEPSSLLALTFLASLETGTGCLEPKSCPFKERSNASRASSQQEPGGRRQAVRTGPFATLVLE